ncbi:solute carrier family 45 member 4 isoform X3 [Myotis myotis]|uniref:solute carrier family 45 member 4 isoform X3 n=1 Tax=Myotis myotis TaxID=51298 RepID=UPI001749AC31|nr:solute carrier family 45 member 4 isoform X3 [Myotis myotis]
MRMAPQNADSESMQVQELPVALPELRKPAGAGPEPRDETVSEGSIDRIPVRLWVMHGAVMFGREFCYAMETALVTPILLQIGLVLGDVPGQQPIGIVLTVLGVVVLDFSADATEGPIRAYLLDVVDSEDQDMALNIHAFSAGLGGAIGYVLGGLDWTQTFLGSWFRTQNQVLFFFAAVVFTASVALHLFSIEEEQYCPQQERAEAAPPAPPSLLDGGLFPDEVQSEQELALDYLGVELVRSKSDSVLHVPDATLDLEPELLFLRGIEPSIFHDASGPGTPHSASQDLGPALPPRLSSLLGDTTKEDAVLLDNHTHEAKVPNGSGSPPRDGPPGYSAGDPKPLTASSALRRRRHGFRRQASSTFSYYGKIGSHCYRYRRANAVVLIKPSRSMSDLYDLQKRQRQRSRHRNQSGATTSSGDTESEEGEGETTVRLLWLSMLKMPRELTRLCLCHLLTWFSVIAEAVFYTDFMGQVIFKGDPKAPSNSTAWQAYNAGVKMGCWGLVIYAATGAICSEVPGQLRPEHPGHLRAGDAGLLRGHRRDGHVRQRLRGHDHDQHHGRRVHEHLLLPLRPAGAVSRHQGVHPPQPRELQARLWHRLRHPLLPGLHLPDPGGVGPRGRGGRRGHREGHPHGGLRGLLPGLPVRHVPGDLPGGVGRGQGRAERPVRPATGRGQRREAHGPAADAEGGPAGACGDGVHGLSGSSAHTPAGCRAQAPVSGQRCFRGRASPGACPARGGCCRVGRATSQIPPGFTFSTIKNHLKSFFF